MTKIREDLLKEIINDTLWMATRYAHGRQTMAPSMIRSVVKAMKGLYPDWEPKQDRVIEPPEKDFSGLREDYLDDIFNSKETL